jgi:tight adherence protein B
MAAWIAVALAVRRVTWGEVVSRAADRARPAGGDRGSGVSHPRREASPRARAFVRSRAARAAAAAIVGWAVGGIVVGILAAVLAVSASTMHRRRQAGLRAAAMDDGMADGVRAIAAGLRAGLSVPQAIRFAADEAEPPLATTLGGVVDAVEVGEPLDEAIGRWASDVGTDDARLVEGVLGLHRRSGGDLPRVLDRVADTLRERRASSREVRALTAQARLSGAILGCLPIGFFAFLWLTSRRDIEGAFRTTAGLASFVVGITLELIAFVWIRRLLEVR